MPNRSQRHVQEFYGVPPNPGGGDTTPPTIISSPNQTVPENTGFSFSLQANEPVTWAKIGGADQALFTLTGSQLSIGPMDFENPADADANNIYVVQVRATDLSGNFTNQTISLTVTDKDDTAPVITSSPTQTVVENAAFSMTLTANETVTWAKVGGADTALFTLTGATLSMTAKDFEAPIDSDGNNTYVVTVQATDTALNQSTPQTITVTVTNVAEGIIFLDTFNRANANLEASLAASGGWNWTHDGLIAGGLSINANQLRCNIFDDPGTAYKTPTLGSPDHYVEFKVASISQGGGPFVCARFTDRNNFIGFRVTNSAGNGTIQIFVNNANSYSSKYASAAGACVVGDVLRLQTLGANYFLFKNGVQVTTGAIGTLVNSNFAGIIARSNAVDPFIDDFQAGAP